MGMFPQKMQGLSGALKESYPLLLAMSNSMGRGQGVFGGTPQGLAAMMAMGDKRKAEAEKAAGMAREKAEKAQAAQMMTGFFNGLAPEAAPITPTRTADVPGLPRSVVDAVDRVDPQYSGGSKEDFIAKMMPHAMRVSQQTGLDPRLVIAQAAQETGWGKSAPNNNYFGVKSHGKPGGLVLSTSEHIGGQNQTIQDSFRGYGGMGESADDYARFLQENPRYAEMLGAGDLNGQVDALGRSGYATDPNYANSVGRIARSIEIPGQAAAQKPPLDPQRAAAIMASEHVAPAIKQMVLQRMMAQGQEPERKQPLEINGQLVDPDTLEVVGDYRTQPAPSNSAVEQKIQRIMQDQGVDRKTAQGIADGVIVVSRDPMTNEAVILSKTTGQPVGQQEAPQVPPPAAVPPPADNPPSDLTFGEQFAGAQNAFGLEGKLQSWANNAFDAVGATPPYKETQTAQFDFNVLREGLTSDIASGYKKQPPSWLLKNIQELTPETGKIFQGPEGAQGKLQALGRSLQQELESIQRQLARRRMTPERKQTLESQQSGLEKALDKISAAIGAFDAGVGLRPEVADRLSNYE